MLNDLQSQIRLGRVINAGAAGTLYEGYIVDPVLRQRAGEEVVAVKTVQCAFLLFRKTHLIDTR